MHNGLRLVTMMAALSFAPVAKAEELTFYGTSGLIDMPSADTLTDGGLALTSSYFGPTLRNTLTFQITPRLQGSFRYTRIEDYDNNNTKDRFDRSFDLSYQIKREDDFWPAVSVGIRDFGGTGTFAGEYVVATKSVTPDVRVTGGIGWGRLGSRNGFENPLSVLDDRFGNRPSSGNGDINTTGRLDFNTWFRGDAALFGGLAWDVSDKLTVVAEYSSDVYAKEEERGVFTQRSPLNFGLNYQYNRGLNVGAYYLYGQELGVRASFVIDPNRPVIPGGNEPAAPALLPRASVAAASWNNGTAQVNAQQVLRARLAGEGLTLAGLQIEGATARLQMINSRFDANAQALGRAARIMANTLPAHVETFDLTFVRNGLPLSTTRLQRSDLEELEFAVDGTWQSFARAQISDAYDVVTTADPVFDYKLGYYLTPALFDPDSPIRIEYGAQLDFSYTPQPNLIFAGRLRQEVGGNLSDATRRSNSILPRVRSDSFEYAAQSQTELSYLTAEYFFRPAPDVFGRVTAGYLEQMFGGVSGEVLWYPIDSNLALGAEVNYVRQRDFDGGLGFQDYEVLTGHGSAYYDFGNGYQGQLDVGRYLAGDWGATVGLDRTFENGFKVGAFFTLTDTPFDDFGEGSFDKGIRLEIPTSWLIGRPTRSTINQTIRPVLRDGGARLNVRNRLYDLTQDTRTEALNDGWGRFWR